MRVQLLGIIGLIGLLFPATAYAGHGSGYTQSHERGIQVYRGHHGPSYSSDALQIVQMRERREAKAKKAREIARLEQQLAVQTAQIEALERTIDDHKEDSHSRKRRRVYYGNPAFFGRNGFVGNRNFSGAIISPPRRRHHYRPYK